ncbi:MAG: DUF2079 domain-containing protein, partial [Propionibacteriaceae bacterium]|nr:DUF2079 domain-containing protein [Propionibacteriaceae bacterium]
MLYSVISLTRFARYQSGFDLGLFVQAVQAYSNADTPIVSLKAQEPFNVLGDHFSPMIALIAPLYHLAPNAQTLLVVQAGLFAYSVSLVGQTALDMLGRQYAAPIAASYGASWAILAAVVFDFHEITFAVPLLILAINAARKERWGWLALWCVLLWLTKEDSTFLVGGIALMLLARRRFVAGLILGASSLTAFIFLVRVIIPHFSYSGTYTYLSDMPSDANTLVHNALNAVLQPEFWIIASLILGTCAPGLRSAIMLVPIPTLLSRFVTDNPAYWSPSFHYQATVFTACFLALIAGWAKVISNNRNPQRIRKLFLGHLLGLVLVSVSITQAIWGWPSLLGTSPPPNKVESFHRVLDAVPPGVAIVADTYAIAHLVDTNTVYLATPSWTDSVGQPLRANWVLLDQTSPAQNNPSTSW